MLRLKRTWLLPLMLTATLSSFFSVHGYPEVNGGINTRVRLLKDPKPPFYKSCELNMGPTHSDGFCVIKCTLGGPTNDFDVYIGLSEKLLLESSISPTIEGLINDKLGGFSSVKRLYLFNGQIKQTNQTAIKYMLQSSFSQQGNQLKMLYLS
jgi:hypothetical protein